MALFLREADVASLVGIEDAIAALDGAFGQWGRDGTMNLPRQRLKLPVRAANLMAASLPESGMLGQKVYYRGFFMVTLYSMERPGIIAMIEANLLGQLRTGAASGIASREMARADATRVALIGGGRQGRTQLLAVNAVRNLTEAAVYNRNEASRTEFATRMTGELGIPVRPASSAEDCVQGADIVITATKSVDPVLDGGWLAPGVHVNTIGANAYGRRELDEAAVQKAGLIAVDDREQARVEARELIDLADAGRLDWETVAELGAIVQGRVPGRQSDRDITLFKSRGIALEDLAFGKLIYDRAIAAGVGQKLDLAT